MKRNNTTKILVGSAMALCSQTVFAAMLNFQQLDGRDELRGVGSVVITKGYVFTYTPAPEEPYPVGLFTVGKSWAYNTGTTALLANSCSALTTLTAEDNSAFSAYSIDLAEVNGPGASSVIFDGTTVSGQHVYQEIQLDGLTGFESFDFSEQFKNLKSMSWRQGDCITNFPHMFDNLFVLSVKDAPPQ